VGNKPGNPNHNWKPIHGEALDRVAIQFKALPGIRERLMAIAGWREKMRAKAMEVIQENEQEGNDVGQ
jgi:hypothetical protein